MPNIGPMELMIILVIVMIFFGVGRLPEIGGAVGKALREFREAQTEVEEAIKPSEKPTSKEG